MRLLYCGKKVFLLTVYTTRLLLFYGGSAAKKSTRQEEEKANLCSQKSLGLQKKEAQCNSTLFLFHLKATEASDSHVKCLCYMPTFLLSFSSLLAKAFCLLAKLSQGSTAAETSTAFILVQFPASFVVHTKKLKMEHL